MLVPAESNISLQTAQLVQSELKSIGIDVNLVALDGNTLMGRVMGGNYQAAILSWELDPDPDPYNIFHSSQTPPHGYNFVFYNNPEADRLIEAGHREIDHAKRVAIYRQLHALLEDEQPYTWIIQVSVKWVINKRVHDVGASKGWGLYNWTPGPLGWWIPRDQRTHDRRNP
jgi:peptide/nickel transport system substrate-binding protein